MAGAGAAATFPFPLALSPPCSRFNGNRICLRLDADCRLDRQQTGWIFPMRLDCMHDVGILRHNDDLGYDHRRGGHHRLNRCGFLRNRWVEAPAVVRDQAGRIVGSAAAFSRGNIAASRRFFHGNKCGRFRRQFRRRGNHSHRLQLGRRGHHSIHGRRPFYQSRAKSEPQRRIARRPFQVDRPVSNPRRWAAETIRRLGRMTLRRCWRSSTFSLNCSARIWPRLAPRPRW